MLPSLFTEKASSATSSEPKKETRDASPEKFIDDEFLRDDSRLQLRLKCRGRPPRDVFDAKYWSENSEEDDDHGDDGNGPQLSVQEVIKLIKDRKRAFFAAKRQHERTWRNLKNDGIPTDEDDLERWVEDWSDAYFDSWLFCIPKKANFEEMDKSASLEFLGAIRKSGAPYDKICSLYEPFLKSREGLCKVNFHSILSKFEDMWHLLNEDRDSYCVSRRCVCPFRNHRTWSECFYLNEQIRPEGWRPNRGIMAKIERQAKDDEVLASFIERHKKGCPMPREISDANFDPRQIHAVFPVALRDEKWKLEKIRNSFLMLDSTYHICRDRQRFIDFVPVYSHLSENNLNCIGDQVESLPVFGIGDVIIHATTAEGKKKGRRIRLLNVRYCPWAPCNAVSISRNEVKGLHWDESKKLIYVERDGSRMDIAKVEKRFGFNTLEYRPYRKPEDVKG